ncbi:flagellar hook-associated protein FliD [compost metagenome]
MTGQITFDKEKFKEKLATDPEAVAKMFNAAPVTDGNGDTTFAGGIGYMFENNLKPWTQSGDGFMASRISAYESDNKFLTKQMEDMDIRLNKRQASLERKFVQLEKSMSLLNNQLSWMKTQANSLTGSSSKS